MIARKVPTLRHHKPSGRAVVTLGGKDHYCGAFGSPDSRREYDRVVGEWLAAGRPSSGLSSNRSLTMAELLLRYMDFARDYYAPPSRELEGIALALRPLKEHYAHTFAADFGPLALRTVRDRWIQAGLSRRHINARVGKIRRFFKWAISFELLPPAVLDGLNAVEPLMPGRTAARETAPRAKVSDAVFLATLPHLPPMIRAMVELMWWCGARPSEVCKMRTTDIDRSGRVGDVPVWVYTPRSHKTARLGHEKRICLGPRAQRVLAPWLRDDGDEYVFQPREAVAEQRAKMSKDHRTNSTRARAAANKRRAAAEARKARTGTSRPMSRREAGDHYTSPRLANAVRRACIKHKIPRWTPYMIRHATCTRIEQAVGFEASRQVLGHRSGTVTARYIHADGQAAAAVMAVHG